MNMPMSVDKFSIIIPISKIQILIIFSHHEKQNPYNIYCFLDLLTTFLENQFEAQLNQTPAKNNCTYTYIVTPTFKKKKIMAHSPISSWQIDGEKVATLSDFIFLGSKLTTDGDCSHKIKRLF